MLQIRNPESGASLTSGSEMGKIRILGTTIISEDHFWVKNTSILISRKSEKKMSILVNM
jgi:hypothetical protein